MMGMIEKLEMELAPAAHLESLAGAYLPCSSLNGSVFYLRQVFSFSPEISKEVLYREN
jgi:hypothetical protein